MPTYEIPLESAPRKYSVNLNGRSVIMTVRWNDMGGGWYMNLDDKDTDSPIIHGIPMMIGGDLLDAYKHLGIPCGLHMNSADMKDATRDNLGRDVRLYMVTEES